MKTVIDGYRVIVSDKNPMISRLVRLFEKPVERRKTGLFVLEGLHLTEAWLAQGGQLQTLFVRESAREHQEVLALRKRIPTVECVYMEGAALQRLSSLSSAPEVLALAKRESVKLSVLKPHSDAVLLEAIRDPGNLGTILRTVAASGIGDVFLSSDCVDVWSPKVLRAGMGAHFILSLHTDADLPTVLRQFSGQKWVTALNETAQSLYECDLRPPCAFVFGNEGAGVSDALVTLAQSVKIPMLGQVESLNVGIAVGVCVFEQMRQRLI